MQPTLAIVAPAPGMIALNGRFAGEVSPGEALLAAVPLCGAVYLEYRPLVSGWLPMARRLVLSGGAPMAESLPDGVFAVFWPGNITEIELSPDEAHAEIAGTLPPEGMPCLLVRGSQRRLEIGGLSCELPRGAQLPSLNRLDGCIALTGEARDGQYLLLLAPDFSRQTGALQADEIGFESAQIVRALTSAGDPSGRCALERWQADAGGLRLLSSEAVWRDGGPRAPATADEAVQCAVDAALAGDIEDSARWFAPSARGRLSLEAIGNACDLCLPMKYGYPGGEPCVGLMQMDTERSAHVRPLFYRAEFTDGSWQITALELPAQGAFADP